MQKIFRSLKYAGILLTGLFFFASCNYTKHLAKDQYVLVRNTVKVDVPKGKGQQFDDLIYLVRPIPNKKFMEVFPIKVSLWTLHQPKADSVTGIVKDSKTNKWLREKGESPVLMDTSDIQRSITQIRLSMFQRGYFDATVIAKTQYLKKQKVRVNYFVTPNQPYTIRSVNYQIEIPEYKRIIITDTANAFIKKGMIYDEELFVAERTRLTNQIKDQGYFYANTEMITFLIDTVDAFEHKNTQGNPTVALTIKVAFDNQTSEILKSKSRNRYKFNNALIYTNYDLNLDKSINLDTVYYFDFRTKSDSTLYKFLIQKKLKQRTNRVKLIKDYTSRTISSAIWMKKGDLYTQTAYDRTAKKLRDLGNFTIINITYREEEALWDSINKIGALNTVIRLTRAKQHTIGAGFDLRTDRTTLALSYLNRNIFRGAEYFNIKAYGSVYYYNWFNSIIGKNPQEHSGYDIYGEMGGEVSLQFPRLLLLPKYQNIKLFAYATEIKVLCSYSQLYSRLSLQASYAYRWSPVRNLTHTVSPVELATLNNRNLNMGVDYITRYSESYQRKFQKFFLPSARYALFYDKPYKNNRNSLKINFYFETVGVLLYAANKAINSEKVWKIFNTFNYGTFEKFDFNLVYTKTINSNNAFATRFLFGMAIPYQKGAIIPFEKSFFVGGASSMRGWSFRQLGPGAYDSKDNIEHVGDMRLELNLEYRGTIYKAFKFGIFSDIGNVWLLSKYDDMPNAEFHFNTFYKQIAACVGLGIRLDFSFFIIRLDYGLPIYDPSKPTGNYWISKSWIDNGWWKGTQGIQFGINYAF